MKSIHLLSVLGLAAAFGVAHALPAGSSHALTQPPSPPQASVVPPWLVEPAVDDTDEPRADPHAGLHAGTDDPHAGVDHPHAGVDDPHAGVDHPHAGVEDPHAGVYPEVEPELDADDPYERVGLAPAPELRVDKLERSRAPNGHSVEELHAGRQKLAGQKLRVRGTVVKLNEGILGKTYLHLRDGSGSAERGDDDLTVTTTEAFELGEIVELEGELAIDQDVGAGYVYAALLTQATRVGPQK